MPLTEPQAKVLAALATLDPTQTLTIQQLCNQAGFKEGCTRAAVNALAGAGLAHGTQTSPARWRITNRGRTLLQAPPYREFRQPGRPPAGTDSYECR